MKIRSLDDVNRALADDLIWRKKELSALKFLVESKSDAESRKVLLRSAVALLYAHWEGFVKRASTIYLDYIRHQRLRYDELSPNFIALAAHEKLRSASVANRIRPHIEVATFFVTGLSSRSTLPRDCIRTHGNLSSAILHDIAETLALDYAPYETKARLIDEKLVQSRNSIAHGEYLEFDLAEYIELYVEVLALMELFRNQVDNAASTGAFRSTQLARL
jgi:hypothetical protein